MTKQAVVVVVSLQSNRRSCRGGRCAQAAGPVALLAGASRPAQVNETANAASRHSVGSVD